jgi:Trk-type K+ transport system membrane component
MEFKMTTLLRRFRPSQAVALSFSLIIFVGTSLLSLPVSRTDGKFGMGLDQLFTTVSALCVTGLAVVDTETYWTSIGHFVILALIKVGGFGIMAFTGLLALLVVNKLSMRATAFSSEEHRALKSGDIKSLLIRIALVGFVIEALSTLILMGQFRIKYGYELSDAFWYGLFHSVSAFNNAGFGLYSDSLIRFNADPIVLFTLCTEIILGSLGFPVLLEIGRHVIQKTKSQSLGIDRISLNRWSLTSRIVIAGSAILLVGGFVYFAALEWNNPNSIGQMPAWQKLMNAFVLSVMPRTAGFNAVDIGALTHESWLGMDILMFIGGGSGGTSGGIKIGTMAVLIFIVISEIRNTRAVNIGKRRLPRSIHREAITLLFLYGFLLIAATLLLQLTTEFTTDQILFEVSSALGTAGLSTGITAKLPAFAQVVIIILMFLGRVGPALVASSLAVRIGKGFTQYPKERPTIG